MILPNASMKRLILYPLTLGLVVALGIVPGRSQSENSTNPEPEDPSGNAGTVKSTVETGGSYNAYNGNASRSITDLQVPGAPGVYGLDFTRHWNSTDPMYSPFGQFGPRPFGNGGWTHSWNWSASPDMRSLDCPEGGCPPSYLHIMNIEYPDGRTAKFSFVGSSQSPEYPPVLTGAFGTDDHLGGIDPAGLHFWLYLADGGSVRFEWFHPTGYRAIKVVDPHGLATELFYQNDAFGDRLWRVAGPDGRSIFLEYGALGNHPAAVIRKVGWGVSPGSYFQTVEYDYSHYSIADPATAGAFFDWYALTGVRYMDDVNVGQLVQATYTYTPFATHDTDPTPGTPSPQGRGPLLTTAEDPRFEGPMSRIRYVFRGGPDGEPFCQSVDPTPFPGSPSMMYAPFPVEKEISLDTGQVVSQLWIPCNGRPESGMRTEYRGAGGARIFQFGRKGGLEPGAWMEEIPNGPDRWHPPEADPGPMSGPPGYNAGYEITRLTDFADNPNPATMPTDFHHNFRVKPYRSFDARGKLTEHKYQTGDGFEGPAGNGRVNEVRHRTPGDDTKRTYHWDNPPGLRDEMHIPNTYHHWLFSQTDERNNTTTYTRDSLMRVTQISYYNGPAQGNPVATESFTYNQFNQVTSHTLPSGGVKNYDYNGSFLWREWNDVDTIDEATIYTPDSFGRVATAQNARARAAGSYSAVMEYNSRHQVTKVHYPSTGWSSDPTVIYEYDKYGNCTAITNERGYRSTYTYDAYGRCLSYTEPVNAPACGGSSVGSRTWNWDYNRIATDGPRDASTHTSNKWRLQIEPAYNAAGDRRATVRHYDYNERLVFEFIGAILPAGGGDWNYSHGALHQYQDDPNGNKTKYTDPYGRVTTYGYDHRNRLITATETKRPDQQTNPVTLTEYDATGNKTRVTFPDETFQEWRFHDPFGQPAQFFDERHNMTSLYYRWGPMKLPASVVTRRERDGDETEEEQLTAFWHDKMGRLTETFFPDESYEKSTYDLGQLKSWRTRKGATKTITSYDARGRETAHTWSDDTPGVTRLWDDANRLVNLANSVSSIDYSYDQAGQVREEGTAIVDALGQSQSGRKEVSYCRYPNGEISRITYPNGLSVQRTYTARGQLESVNWSGGSVSYEYLPDGKVNIQHYGNGVHTGFDYDERGFTRVVHHQSPLGNISHRTYWRDNRDRIIGWAKSGSGGMNPKENGRGDRYQYDDEGQLKLASYEVENPQGGGTGPMRADIFTYDKMGNRMGTQNHVASRGWLEFKRRNNGLNQYGEWYSIIHHDDHWAPPNEPEKANEVLMQEGWIGASFNALNQPIAMYSGSTLPKFVWFGYDPLGRCAKRWLGNDQGEAPEPEGSTTPGSPNPVATYLYYDGWNLVQEGTAADSPTLLYVHGGRVDEVVAQIKPQSNTLRYLQYDARGHCTFQTDTTGQSWSNTSMTPLGCRISLIAGATPPRR